MDPIPIPQAVLDQMAQEKIVRQFKDVFGVPPAPGEGEKRTESQIAVWENLKKAGNFKSTVFLPDRNGDFCPLRAAFADGQRWMFLYILANLEYAPKIDK